jgi:hypothetical protein
MSSSSDPSPLIPHAARTALIVIAALIVVAVVLWQWVVIWARRTYRLMVSNNTINVDDSFLHDQPSARSCLKCVLLHKFNVGWSKQPKMDGLELTATPSDKVIGLKVTFKKKNGKDTKQEEREEEEEEKSSISTATTTKLPPLVIGTIR